MMLVGAIVWWRQRKHPDASSGKTGSGFPGTRESSRPSGSLEVGHHHCAAQRHQPPLLGGHRTAHRRSHLSVPDRATIIFVTSVVASITFVTVTVVVLAGRGRFDPLLGRGRDFVLRHSGSVVPGFLAGCGIRHGARRRERLGLAVAASFPSTGLLHPPTRRGPAGLGLRHR